MHEAVDAMWLDFLSLSCVVKFADVDFAKFDLQTFLATLI